MKQQETEHRTIRLNVKLTPAEWETLNQLYSSSTHRVFSIFIRALLFRKPLVKKVRDQSLDDVLVALIGIRNELEIVCRSFTAVELAQHTAEIKTLLLQLYEKCSQVSRP